MGSLDLSRRQLGQLSLPHSMQLLLQPSSLLDVQRSRAEGAGGGGGRVEVTVLGAEGPPVKKSPFATVFEEEAAATTAAYEEAGTGSGAKPAGLLSPPSGLLQATNFFGLHAQGSLATLKPSMGSVGALLGAVPLSLPGSGSLAHPMHVL